MRAMESLVPEYQINDLEIEELTPGTYAVWGFYSLSATELARTCREANFDGTVTVQDSDSLRVLLTPCQPQNASGLPPVPGEEEPRQLTQLTSPVAYGKWRLLPHICVWAARAHHT